MRFDDMLATVLARPAGTPAGRIAQWRQLLDLLAQGRFGGAAGPGRTAFDRLAKLRAHVPVAVRQETARSLSGRPIPAALVAFLAADVPGVAGVLLAGARLPDTDWLAILPRLSPTGRGFLRHRRDLGPHVEAALSGFGATDLVIAGEIAPAAPPVPPQQSAPPEEGASLEGAEPVDADEIDAPAAARAAGDAPPEPEAEPAGLADIRRHPLFDDLPTAPFPDAPPTNVRTFEPTSGEGQIRAIISRIALYKRGREEPLLPGLDLQEPEPIDGFLFETSADGVIRWVEGAPRGALVGETIATPATGSFGVDAQAPGAFRRRAPFRDARLAVAGSGPVAGEWRIAGVPVFAAQDGRFLGYRGTARRPAPGDQADAAPDEREAAGAAPAGLYGGGLPADSIRQLVHELRTPLNAIGGFAEMIRRQMRGPISAAYRDRAQAIVEHAGRLLAAVDDLDVAARLETQRLDLQRIPIDLGPMLMHACAAHTDAARARGVTLACEVAPHLPQAEGDPSAMRRMMSRLAAASAALADEGETIRAELAPAVDGPGLLLSVTRPARLAAMGEADLLDPGYGPEGDWPDAPLLGLGFSLHLLRRLAAAAGGSLAIGETAFLLRVPAVAGQASAQG